MIIWGSRGRTSVVQEGQFFCPRCRSNQPYKLKRVQRWFTLYFIPIIPMGVLGEYAECGQCLTTWKTEVLTAGPPADREQTVQDELRRAMRRSMAMVLLASGREDPAAIDAGSRIFRKQIGMSMPDAELSRELKDVKEQGIDVKRYLANFGAHLSAQQKEALVTAACEVALFDGPLEPVEQEAVSAIAQALGVTDAHLRGILAGIPAAAASA
ncbi:MAG TPA: TerB family tellurite resistance protein [Myxococcaceae bacterium]|nr:TerB family tellurite resistance protein [Myxococcaceae bacterium]